MALDAAQVAEMVDRHAAALLALAAQWSDTPEDLVQEAFCRLVQQRKSPANPRAWLFQVVRNLGRQRHRAAQRRRRRETKAAEPESVWLDLAASADAKEAAGHLNHLDPDLREIVVMRLWGGLTFEEAAVACGLSTATAHRRYQTALQELRKRMKVSCPSPP